MSNVSKASQTEAAIDEHLQRFEVDGYTIIEHAIDADTVQTIRAELAPWFTGEKMGRNNFEGECSERVYALLAKAPAVERIIEHPTILAMLGELLPANFLLSAALAINVHPGETPQPWHIDDAAGGLPWPKPRPRFGVSTLWAIDDFTEHNGATEVIPGSHLWAASREPLDSEVVKVLMPAGSVVIFDGRLLHRGGANHANSKRLAITPQYCAPGLRQIENMVLAIPPQLAARFSDRIKNMLGYNIIEPGFMGYVDGRHPRKLIDPDYRGRKYRSDLPPS